MPVFFYAVIIIFPLLIAVFWFRLKAAKRVKLGSEKCPDLYQEDTKKVIQGNILDSIEFRKQSEKESSLNEARYIELMNNIPSGVVVYEAVNGGEDFIIKELSRSVEKIESVSKKDVIGKSVLQVFPGVKEMGIFAAFQRVWSTGVAENFPVKAYRDGRISGWRENCIYKLKSGEVVAVYNDVTRQREAEQKLDIYRNNLEELVSKRTSQLEASNKELDAFSYSVSHDLKAPLRAIDGFSAILIEECGNILTGKAKENLSKIRENTKKMNALIESLLTFAHLGRQELNYYDIDMNRVAAQVSGHLKDINPGRKIEFRTSDLPKARGDASLVQVVFINIISNAVKFTRPRAIAIIEIGGAAGKDENVYYVKDNGIGFDMAYSKKLFTTFQRIHSVGHFEGLGIGLSIVHRIIMRHGGRVWAESEPDKGATFFFTLPLKTSVK